ncbi:alpha-1,2-fucosyltransferase [Polaribacter sp. SA4-10]|uniref:alpha-1,2-fucosyltransferase n=1 Tax=Polaribacter sp. SA4-10 TaxID=754397 RepID=UPI000B3BFDA4|nr:alpha-1,2-fucosyltransferase [Polaribacter sp. SA4-10]ARV05207.1 alpha-1,2-fucosyltransferase [Polaribacter sp. SA4-10]
MITVRIVGGLGNQMFQYAYAKALEQKGYAVKIDTTKFKKYKLHGGYQLDKFNIDLNSTSSLPSILSKIGIVKSIKEKNLLFDKQLTSLRGNKYVKGYFQTEKYFNEIRAVLLNQFIIKNSISEDTNKVAKTIFSSINSCSLHIRRGDYISDKKANSVHGTCALEYYEGAIKIMNDTYKNSTFFVFSDDIPWTKENLKIENAFYVDTKTIPHEDMYLMSLCKNNITANSSFSWWGAWLNKNHTKTVIAPKNWFVNKENEVACENWIKL